MGVLTQSQTPAFQVCVPSLTGGADQQVPVFEKTSDQFAARLRKVFKDRRKWAQRSGVFCYRIYDADLPDYAVAIDLYECTGLLGDSHKNFAEVGERFLSIAEYAAPAEIDAEKAARRFADVVAVAPVVCGVLPENVFAKERRHDKGGAQYAENGDSFTFRTTESGYAFEIDLGAYLDTGLFLDHRTTREMVGRLAQGKRFLNLFAYTGSATVHAAVGGAVSTVTVDLSQTYLDWARRNMAENGYTGASHTFERSDTLTWLRHAAADGRTFDLVFVDPPTFSNSKSMKQTWDVQRDQVELLSLIKQVLAPGGTVVFSCNLRSFKLDTDALSALGYEVQDITAQTIPYDFARNPKIHQCYLLT